jgi:hypothetical protein
LDVIASVAAVGFGSMMAPYNPLDPLCPRRVLADFFIGWKKISLEITKLFPFIFFGLTLLACFPDFDAHGLKPK